MEIEQSKRPVLASAKGLPLEGIVRTYRGRPGCGCGCRGTYAEASKPIATRSRALDLANAIRRGETIQAHGAGIRSDDESFVIAYETDSLYLWVYFRDRKAAEAFVGAALLAGDEARDLVRSAGEASTSS